MLADVAVVALLCLALLIILCVDARIP